MRICTTWLFMLLYWKLKPLMMFWCLLPQLPLVMRIRLCMWIQPTDLFLLLWTLIVLAPQLLLHCQKIDELVPISSLCPGAATPSNMDGLVGAFFHGDYCPLYWCCPTTATHFKCCCCCHCLSTYFHCQSCYCWLRWIYGLLEPTFCPDIRLQWLIDIFFLSFLYDFDFFPYYMFSVFSPVFQVAVFHTFWGRYFWHHDPSWSLPVPRGSRRILVCHAATRQTDLSGSVHWDTFFLFPLALWAQAPSEIHDPVHFSGLIHHSPQLSPFDLCPYISNLRPKLLESNPDVSWGLTNNKSTVTPLDHILSHWNEIPFRSNIKMQINLYFFQHN